MSQAADPPSHTQSTASPDAELLRRTAHTLRSMSGTLGANELDELSRTLELDEFPPGPATLAAFEDSVRSTRAVLDAWLTALAETAPSAGSISVG